MFTQTNERSVEMSPTPLMPGCPRRGCSADVHAVLARMASAVSGVALDGYLDIFSNGQYPDFTNACACKAYLRNTCRSICPNCDRPWLLR